MARAAEVSPATASRVLNGDPRVHADLRSRVERAVAALHYRPNGLARNLARQRSATIGMLVADIEHPYFSAMVRSVEDLAYALGHRVLVCNTDENPEKQRSYLLALEDERVAGLIASPTDAAAPELSRLLDHGIPIVAFDRRITDPRADAVTPDNLGAARVATERLIAAGHTAIATIAGLPGTEAGAERLAGYQIAMQTAGLEPRSVQGDFRVEGGRTAGRELLAAPGRPSALVVANSLMALGAIQVMRELGVRDLAMICIGEPPWAEIIDPPLTTMTPPVKAIASDAMELLQQRILGTRDRPRQIVHPFQLVARGSG